MCLKTNVLVSYIFHGDANSVVIDTREVEKRILTN